jgi:hypothetical protein
MCRLSGTSNSLVQVHGLGVDTRSHFPCSKVTLIHVGAWKQFNIFVRSEVIAATTVNNAVFWDVVPGGSYKNPTFRRNVSPPSSGR